MSTLKNLAGQRFGRLVVLRRAEPPTEAQREFTFWECRCDCGKVITRRKDQLTARANTPSCGCFNRDRFAELAEGHVKHGAARAGRKSPEYDIWCGMKQRCLNPNDANYKNYGAVGIAICERWLNSFEAFKADMGRRPSPKHSIDRINPFGNYEPSNCRWATSAQQSRNRRSNHEKWNRPTAREFLEEFKRRGSKMSAHSTSRCV